MHVIFDNTWSDPEGGRLTTNALAIEGVDVVTMIVDSRITVSKRPNSAAFTRLAFIDKRTKIRAEGLDQRHGFTWGGFLRAKSGD